LCPKHGIVAGSIFTEPNLVKDFFDQVERIGAKVT